MNVTSNQGDELADAHGRRPVSIIVTILSDSGSGTFDISSKHVPVKKKGGPENAVITFNNWQDDKFSDGFEVTFDLVDETGKGYGFFQKPKNPSPNDAMSVRAIGLSGHCPSPGDTWDGFTPSSVTQCRQHLSVDNPNNHLQYFGFALHFSLEGEHAASLTYDPIGDNQNGNARIRIL